MKVGGCAWREGDVRLSMFVFFYVLSGWRCVACLYSCRFFLSLSLGGRECAGSLIMVKTVSVYLTLSVCVCVSVCVSLSVNLRNVW